LNSAPASGNRRRGAENLLTFAAEKPPPSYVFEGVALMAAASAYTHGEVLRGSMSAVEESGGCE